MQSIPTKNAIKILKMLALLALLLVIMLSGNQLRQESPPETEELPIAETPEVEDGYDHSVKVPRLDRTTITPQANVIETDAVPDEAQSDLVDLELQRLKRQLEKNFDVLMANRTQVPKRETNSEPPSSNQKPEIAETKADEDTFAARLTITLRRDLEILRSSSQTNDSQVLADEVLAKQMYDRGCQFMDSSTRKNYSLALAFFRKAIEIVPDPDFEYHKKARERIALIESAK